MTNAGVFGPRLPSAGVIARQGLLLHNSSIYRHMFFEAWNHQADQPPFEHVQIVMDLCMGMDAKIPVAVLVAALILMAVVPVSEAATIDSDQVTAPDTGLSADLPSSYDLRDHFDVTPVKDQLEYGTCTQFATVSSPGAATPSRGIRSARHLRALSGRFPVHRLRCPVRNRRGRVLDGDRAFGAGVRVLQLAHRPEVDGLGWRTDRGGSGPVRRQNTRLCQRSRSGVRGRGPCHRFQIHRSRLRCRCGQDRHNGRLCGHHDAGRIGHVSVRGDDDLQRAHGHAREPCRGGRRMG